MDWSLFFTVIGSAIGTITIIYAFLRNFKADINSHIDKLDKRITTLEDGMFWMATGKKLEDAILEERLKSPKTNP